MAQILKLPEFVQDYGMPQMDVRSGGIEAQFDPQRNLGLNRTTQLIDQFLFGNDFRGAAPDNIKLTFYFGFEQCASPPRWP